MVNRLLTLCLSAVVLMALAGCTAVVMGEIACDDRIDNDGDGLTDRDDEDCRGGGESTRELCRNQVDDDADGQRDCEDPDCQSAGHCEAIETACENWADAPCPIGMGCFFFPVGTAEFGTECRVPGRGVERQPCRTRGYGPSEPHDCARDYHCDNPDRTTGEGGICSRMCGESHPECEAYSLCLADPGFVAPCLTICDPRPASASGCSREGWRCLSQHELGTAYASGGGYYQCANNTWGRRGWATDGQPCADPPVTATSEFEICSAGYVCIPAARTGAAGPTCRATCNASSGSGCVAETCHRIYDGPGGIDGNEFPPVGYGGIELGYCAP